jgi:hypothetical protein
MPIDPTDALQFVERSLSSIPAAVVVIVLLAGPTTVWLLYRFVVQPRTSRYANGHLDVLWVCSDCRSVNEVRLSRCYRCGLERAAITGALQVFDGDGLVTLDGDEHHWAADAGAIEPAALESEAATTATAMGTRPDPAPLPALVGNRIAPRPLVAVGPGKPPPAAAATSPAVEPAAVEPPTVEPAAVEPAAVEPEPAPAPEPAPVLEPVPEPVAVPVARAKKRTRSAAGSRRSSAAPAADPVDPIVEG